MPIKARESQIDNLISPASRRDEREFQFGREIMEARKNGDEDKIQELLQKYKESDLSE